MRWRLLNHPLTEETPQYGTNPTVQAESISSISSGATSNTHMLHLHNHSGTHVDAPRHFRKDGLTIADFPRDFWHFERVFLLDLTKEANALISAEEIERHRQDIEGCELLLIRTGYERYRSPAPERYWLHNPGFTPEAAHALRSHRHLLAVGVDLISISPYQNPVLGREAHRAFFDSRYADEFILVEDLRLAGIETPDTVIIEPVFKMSIDATPVVVIALYAESSLLMEE